MDLIRHITIIAEAVDPAERFPTADEILATLKLHTNHRESLGQLHALRNQILVPARVLLRNTIKLNNLVQKPDFDLLMTNVSGQSRLKGYWASKLISIPLLKSAIDQLAKAETGPQIAQAIARIVGVVENAEDEIPAPYKTHLDNGEDNYNSIYKYLTKIEGWNEARQDAFVGALATLRDRLVQHAAARLKAGVPQRAPRPQGW